MITDILILCAIVLIPFIELRLAIPVGILTGTILLPFGIELGGLGLNPFLVFGIAVVSNILLGFIIFNFLSFFDEKLKKTRFAGHYIKILERSQRKIRKYVDKYGVFGLAVFIGIPLPGSGIYSGSLGAFVLGMRKRDFYLATVIGVLIAGVLVTGITLLGISIL